MLSGCCTGSGGNTHGIRHRNNGFRLDHVFLSRHLAPHLTACRHDWGTNPAEPDRREGLSDHAAVVVDLG